MATGSRFHATRAELSAHDRLNGLQSQKFYHFALYRENLLTAV